MEKQVHKPLIRLSGTNPYRMGMGLVFLIAITAIQFLFGDIFLHPDSYMLVSEGDGLKSYFVSVYHLQYDTAYGHTLAMNYPFGERLQYTDCQPALTNAIKLLNAAFPGIGNYFPGILHVLLMAGILAAALLLYDILMMLGIHWIFSAFWANGIVFLSPQIERLQGHLSLAYVFVIPMAIALLIRASQHEKPLHGILYALLIAWSAFTHLYYTAFLLLFLTAFLLWRLWPGKGDRISVLKSGIFLWPLLSFITMLLYQHFSDPFSDRTAYPYGFLYYKAFPESVFLPLRQSYGAVFRTLSEFRYITWEGYAYVGFSAFLITLFLFFRGFRHAIRLHTAKLFRLSPHPLLNALLWASILSLLFSFALPFRFLPPWTVELLGPFKQFRGSGRFSWPFFYMINIATLLLLWQWRQKSKTGKVALILGTCILLAESLYSLNSQRNVLLRQRCPNDLPLSITNDSLRQTLQTYRPQAILYLPYYHVGSENIWMTPVPGELKNSFQLSLESGLPLMNVMLGRTSLAQTQMSVSLVMQATEKPAILPFLEPAKPILLVTEDRNPLRPGEQELLNRAIPVSLSGMPSGTSYYLLPVDSIRRFTPLYYNGVEQQTNVAVKTLIREIGFNPVEQDSLIEISFGLSGWMEDMVSRTNLIINCLNKNGQEEEILNQAVFNYYTHPFGDHIRVSTAIPVRSGTTGIRVWLHNPEKRKLVISLDLL